MSAPVIWLASIAAIALSTMVGSTAKDKRVLAAAQAVVVTAAVLFLVMTGVGLWEAWSPWEVTKR